ncbi:MAG: GyrI-like domain-containing protein [Chloroflexi bacterium]|nr:GyrI-like domain-containing protein [Chloroflexota bacterium]
MRDSVATSLAVSIKELPAVHVAYIDCKVDFAQGDFSNEIRQCFQRVQTWVRELGYDPYTLLTIGVIQTVDSRRAVYTCCVQIPGEVQSGSDGVGIRELLGGRYAVVSIKKEPAIIGDSISRFYQEYAPQNNIEIDGTRPTYEIYYESTVEYCVPIR